MNRLNRIASIEKKIRVNYGDGKRLYTMTDHEGLITIEYKGTTLKNGKIIDEHLPGVKGLTIKEFMKQWCRDQEVGPQIEINFKDASTQILRDIVKSK